MAKSNTQLKLLPGTEPVPVENDGKLAISIGKSRFETKWKNQEMRWSTLVARLGKSIQTKETYSEYMKWGKTKSGKDKQSEVKDVGGFVGGYVPNGRRLKGVVKERQIITLDADFLKEGDSLDERMLEIDKLNVGFVVYSTHKSSPEAPRQRLIIPMSRIVSAEEYEAIARKIAEKIGIDLFDDSTYEAHRLMYWPSHSFDAEPYFYFYDAEWLDPDAILDEYPDWTDTSFWPYSSRVSEIQKREMDKAGDPMEKPGIIGAFNRAHPIREVLEQMLSDVYTPCTNSDRFTYIDGSTSAGLILYENEGFVYSHHSTDPAAGLSNAFDLVRIHKFGHLDEDADPAQGITKMPSYKAMMDFAQKDDAVKVALAEARMQDALAEFAGEDPEEEASEDGSDWRTKLEVRKDGSIAPNARNALVILLYDEHLKSIRLNTMTGMLEAPVDALPWKRDFVFWQNTDTEQLYIWVANNHGVQFPKELFQMALTTVANKRRFHPIEDYLSGLPEWDGEKRAEKLLVDYLGAEDTAFNREAMVKVLLAAIARIYRPGIKFDYMLVLNGPQGIGKSTFFGRIFKGFLSDSLTMLDMRDKTGSEKLQGYWALEVAEMAGMRKADIECVKSFISRQEDIYRPAYGRVVEKHPRRCVIVGSTNSSTGFLRDITGNRRFWPVRCNGGKLKPWDLSDEDLDQIWAEALARYESGESLLLSHEAEEIAAREQKEAIEEDPRMAQVVEYLERQIPKNWEKMDLDTRRMFLDGDTEMDPESLVDRQSVSNMEIWVECFNKKPADMERKDSDAITALMMKVDGWERSSKQKRIPLYGKQRIYERMERVEQDFSDF
jgi:hypothetical protein